MRASFGRYLAAVLTATCAAAQSGGSSDPKSVAASGGVPTLEQFMKIRTPGSVSLLPDGSLLVRDWPDGVWQLYRVTPTQATKTTKKDPPAQAPSYAPGAATFTKLTTFPDGLAGYSLSPDGKKVILRHAQGGNENTQLSFMDPAAAPGTPFTPVLSNPKVQASVNHWLPDSSAFFYSANDESPNDFYLYRFDFTGAGGHGKATKILGKPGSWRVGDASRDGARVLVTQAVSASDGACHELDLKTGELRDLTVRPEGGTAACEVVGYLAGDAAVLMTSDIDEGKSKLFRKDLKTGAISQPVPDLGRFELDGAAMNDAKTLLAAVTNEDGYGVAHVYSLPDFTPLPLLGGEKGVIAGGQFHGNTLIWTLSNARKPGLAFATTWPEPGMQLAEPMTRQLTFTDTQGVDLDSFALPELVQYSAFDGMKIPAFLLLPPGHKKGTAVPFIVNYHGGPEGQHRPGFSAATQYLLAQGFGMLMPNVRGSTGYGRAFQMLDDYKKRWDSVRDGVDAAEWLASNGYARPGKIATFGGSYGGFMSVACLVEDQQRVEEGKRKERLFGAGVDVVGVVNMKTFLEKTSGYRRKLREVEYGPLTDPEFLASISSIHKIDKLKVPMFIAHGYNDPRVPVEEAIQVALALKERGVPTQLFIAPDEGHGFQKLDNRMLFTSRMSDFLKERIGK